MTTTRASRDHRRVLITGSAGFLGTHLVRSYLANGDSVGAVVRTRAVGPRTPELDGATMIEMELLDAARSPALFEGYDLVIHAAAVTRPNRVTPPDTLARVNVEVTRAVVEACRAAGVPRLVHVSSTAAIGISSDPLVPADERFEYNLTTLGIDYATSKHLSERVALEANASGVPTVVVNPGVVFGRHAHRFMGGDVIERVLRRQVCVCTGGGLSVVHVDDVVDGIRRAAADGEPGERYILSGENHSFRAIAEIVCRVAGERRMIVSIPDVVRDAVGLLSNAAARRKRLPPNLTLSGRHAYPYFNSDKARTRLGYTARAFERIVTECLQASGASGSPETAVAAHSQSRGRHP